MNPKGKKENLKPSHPGNTNAERSGLHSERRRAEMAREVRENVAEGLPAFLTEDRLAVYAQTVALRELHAQDIAVHGISDRDGNPRRAVGTYSRLLRDTMQLNDQLQAELAANEAEDLHSEPLSEDELLRLLRDIAHSWTTSPAAAIAAIKILLKVMLERAATPLDSFLVQYAIQLNGMADEQFKAEYEAMMAPITTARDDGIKRKPLREMIEELASREEMGSENELLDLFDALAARLRLPDSSGRVAQVIERMEETEAQALARVGGIVAGLP